MENHYSPIPMDDYPDNSPANVANPPIRYLQMLGGVVMVVSLGVVWNWSMVITALLAFCTPLCMLGYTRPSMHEKRVYCIVLVWGLCTILLYLILAPFEIERPEYTIDRHLDFTVPFYQMYDVNLTYNSLMDGLNAHWNKDGDMQRLPVHVRDVWSSDPLRFEFLQRYWAAPNTTAFVCITENDVLFKHRYFKHLLRSKNDTELMAIQHFWGHSTFESVNFGILCTRHQVSLSTRFYVDFMRRALRSRYRRLMYLNPLFHWVPHSLLLGWDRYHGCTRFASDCNYIHFTRPKKHAMAQAMTHFPK